MTRAWKFTLIGCFAAALTSCQVSKAEFDALKNDYASLKGDLRTWADSMQAWGARTKNAICDIVAKNPAPYANETTLYCGPGSGSPGNPPPPPPFGS